MTPRRDLLCSLYLGFRNRAPARLIWHRLDRGQEEKLLGQDLVSEHSRITLPERERIAASSFACPRDEILQSSALSCLSNYDCTR